MILTHILDLFALFIYVTLAFLCLLGWGSLVRGLVGVSFKNEFKISTAWLGLIASLAFVETCHLWTPIDWKVSLALLIIGTIGWLRAIKNDSADQLLGLKNVLSTNVFVLVISFLLVLIVSTLALNAPTAYDSGLYHFQSIRWLNEYPIVLGLTNLHGRFGFNQSYFSLIATFNFFPLLNKGSAIGGVLMLLISVSTLVEARLSNIRGGWWANLWILIAYISVAKCISSPSPDGAVILIESSIFVFLITLFASSRNLSGAMATNAAMVFLLSCLLITVKLSALIFAFMSVMCVLPTFIKMYTDNKKLYFFSILLGGYLVTVHLLRGIFYSGLPLYPSAIGAMWNLDWSVAQADAKEMVDWVYSWARAPYKNPGEVLNSWAWFPGWAALLLKEHWRYIYGFLLLSCFNFLALFLWRKQQTEKSLFALYIPPLSGILFWFITAPDWRFLGAIPELCLALSGLLFIEYTLPKGVSDYLQKIPSSLISMFVAAVIFSMMIKAADFKNLSLTGWRPIPSITTKEIATTSGLKILVPEEGDQCWDSPLPCAPTANKVLRLRVESSAIGLEKGFSVQK